MVIPLSVLGTDKKRGDRIIMRSPLFCIYEFFSGNDGYLRKLLNFVSIDKPVNHVVNGDRKGFRYRLIAYCDFTCGRYRQNVTADPAFFVVANYKITDF